MMDLTEHERFLLFLEKIEACEEAVEWVKRNKFEIHDAWNECSRFSWFVYLVCTAAVYYESYTLKSILDYIKYVYDSLLHQYSERHVAHILDERLNKVIKHEDVDELDITELFRMSDRGVPFKFIYGVHMFTTLYSYCQRIGMEERCNLYMKDIKRIDELEGHLGLYVEISDTMYDLMLRFNVMLENEIYYPDIDNKQKLIDEFKKFFSCPTIPDIIRTKG